MASVQQFETAYAAYNLDHGVCDYLSLILTKARNYNNRYIAR